MPQAPDVVLKELKEGIFHPVYFLQGEEPYYLDQITDYIEEHALQGHEKGFNQMVLYGKDVAMNVVITNARRFPMMAQRQVVIVREAQEIQDLGKEAGQKLLLDYLQNPSTSTILVLAHKHKTLDNRKKLAKELNSKATLVTTKKLYDNHVPAWIGDYVKGKGHTIQPKALQMLADYIGTNLERLSNEIDKILINFEGTVEIDPGMVQKYVGISKEYNVFELQKAIALRDVMKANRIVHYFAQNPKENPVIPTIAVLYGFFAKLLMVHHSQDKNERALAGLLKVNPFFVKEYLAAARNYPLGKAVQNVSHIAKADLRSKGVNSGELKDGELLKELVYQLMH
ncbi:MAG TPA: DNA polymerase III subunit delta [Cytophagales bacterium]|nr:DNA polymerase III subunit delta [Cytophagales bacterium]HAA18850.1 DNA polymerase III subunit delta [Cytophagales bacterium]HAP59839.1 DNA polymerase III subunit delta [Cytophagales bacterium]